MAHYFPSKEGSPVEGDELMQTVVAPEVKPLLDELRKLGKLTAKKNSSGMKKAFVNLSALYQNKSIDTGGEDKIDFTNSLTQLVYTIRYGFSHVLSLFTALQRAQQESKDYLAWLSKKHSKSLSICSIAGGPGTDLFAFLAHLEELQKNDQKAPSSFFAPTILDRCTDWQTMYHNLECGVGFPADTEYMHFDFESDFGSSGEGPDTWIDRLKEADVVTMVKFMSIIQRLKLTWKHEEILSQFVKLFGYFKKNGLFIYMDTKYSEYTYMVTEAARKVGFGLCYQKMFKVHNEYECIGSAEVQQDARICVQLWSTGQQESE